MSDATEAAAEPIDPRTMAHALAWVQNVSAGCLTSPATLFLPREALDGRPTRAESEAAAERLQAAVGQGLPPDSADVRVIMRANAWLDWLRQTKGHVAQQARELARAAVEGEQGRSGLPASDCKSDGDALGGSNPPAPIAPPAVKSLPLTARLRALIPWGRA